MKKETILFFEDSSKIIFGGGQELSLLILKSLAESYHIQLFDYAKESLFLSKTAEMGFRHIKLKGYGKVVHHQRQSLSAGALELLLFPFFLTMNCLQIIKYIRLNIPRGTAPLLFANTNKTAILVIIISMFVKCRTVFYAHTVYDSARPITRLFFKLLRKCSMLLTVSETVSDSIPLPCFILSGAVETGLGGHITPRSLSPGEKTVIATFANLQKWKGIDIFIKSFEMLENSNACEFRIYGEGPEKEALVKLAERISGQSPSSCNNITFQGFIDFERVAEDVDIVVLPSLKPEAFGMNIIKAMKYGIPVIAADNGSHGRIITDHIDGLLVPVASPEAIAENIDMLINDKKLYRQISENSLKEVDKYTFSRFSETLIDKLEQL